MSGPQTPMAHRGTKLMRTWPLLTPVVFLLLVWSIVPLLMTLWFSFQRYNLVDPTITGFAGFNNYKFLLEDPAMLAALFNEVVLVGSVLAITIVFGVAFAILFDQEFWGRSIARLFVIAPFFVMPTVSALIWKNLLMNPVSGVFAWVTTKLGFGAIDWFTNYPMAGIVIIVAWQWIPFATLILLTAMQSLDREQMEAARMDAARGPQLLRFVILPHLARPISILLMIETIFLLAIFAEIFITTSGGPGDATTTLTYLIYLRALVNFDVGGASAGGVLAIILANIMAFFLVRTIARNVNI
ncbi:carbohydrate ABC transporter permease [Acidocella sp.]|uniref:carbohydrate ABC transporter permease n=1 Tax=Acidocella sp. TaxID=50710 RepID=UPI0017CDDBB4|nr:sugar ABC transporter permease [Acidocella sp.]NNM58101.1 sugar ABC transporter permease [Acidocella sp.]